MAKAKGDADLAFDEIAAVEPSPEVVVRLLASSGGGRFAGHAAGIAGMFEVTVDRAHELLGLIERSASWMATVPGVAMIMFRGGDTLGRAECVFLRLDPGATFPMHAHVGTESAIVLSGRVRDITNARVLGPGDRWELAGGTKHQLFGDGDEPCICAVCARDGIKFGVV